MRLVWGSAVSSKATSVEMVAPVVEWEKREIRKRKEGRWERRCI